VRIRQLAEQITRGAVSDRERADRLQSWLRDSGTFRYSLELPDTRGADPLEVFLFEARSGHCEYFSTAMAVMLRTLGVPTRNVTGFVGGRYNAFGGYYAIRQGDAHSWLEVNLDGVWTTYDPTPAARMEAVSESWFDDIRAFFDAVRSRWSEDVVGYDIESQLAGLRRLWFYWHELKGREPYEPAAVDEAGDEPSSMPTYAMVALVVAAALVAIFWVARRRATARKNARPDEQAAALYRELEGVLARRGKPRPPALTPREHAQALAAEGFSGSDAVAEVTRRYERARFGAVPLGAADIEAVRGLIAQVKEAGARPD
jgi:hypothetical protein